MPVPFVRSPILRTAMALPFALLLGACATQPPPPAEAQVLPPRMCGGLQDTLRVVLDVARGTVVPLVDANLLRKIDAGADRAITQFFFSADCFLRFRDKIAAIRPDVEVVPGILPVSTVATTRRFAGQCGAAIPGWMDQLFEGLDELPAARQLVAATIAAELCGQLYAGGVRNFHFYTLNRAELAYAICHLLGVRA